MEDNSYDLFDKAKQATTDSMNSLGTGLRRMNRIKTTATKMVKGIVDGKNLVTEIYQKWILLELSNDQRSTIYLAGLRSFDQTLLNTLKTFEDVRTDFLEVATLMRGTQGYLSDLAADYYNRATYETNSAAQKNYFPEWVGEVKPICILPCDGESFGGLFSGPMVDFNYIQTHSGICILCLGGDLVGAVREENRRV